MFPTEETRVQATPVIPEEGGSLTEAPSIFSLAEKSPKTEEKKEKQAQAPIQLRARREREREKKIYIKIP